jgi:hypothetical protein
MARAFLGRGGTMGLFTTEHMEETEEHGVRQNLGVKTSRHAEFSVAFAVPKGSGSPPWPSKQFFMRSVVKEPGEVGLPRCVPLGTFRARGFSP